MGSVFEDFGFVPEALLKTLMDVSLGIEDTPIIIVGTESSSTSGLNDLTGGMGN